MSLKIEEYLNHILEEIEYLEEHSRSLSCDDFLKDESLRRAFSRSLEIIGEATKKIPDEFRQKHPVIEWKSMAGMRDKLIHDYFGIDFELLWDVVQNKIPLLKKELIDILN